VNVGTLAAGDLLDRLDRVDLDGIVDVFEPEVVSDLAALIRRFEGDHLPRTGRARHVHAGESDGASAVIDVVVPGPDAVSPTEEAVVADRARFDSRRRPVEFVRIVVRLFE
jgi:hypothetical protein